MVVLHNLQPENENYALFLKFYEFRTQTSSIMPSLLLIKIVQGLKKQLCSTITSCQFVGWNFSIGLGGLELGIWTRAWLISSQTT